MSPRRVLSLAALAVSVTLSAHASTIVTDTVVFTYTTSLGTEQSNFSFVDGSVAAYYNNDNQISLDLPVTVYPNTDQTGTPNAGGFFYSDGGTGVQVSDGLLNADVEGYVSGSLSGYTSATIPVYKDGFETGEELFLKPGTYTLAKPSLALLDLSNQANDEDQSLVSASFTITQSTSSDPNPPPAPLAVTPEPSSLALLGTGMLVIAGMARRRICPATT